MKKFKELRENKKQVGDEDESKCVKEIIGPIVKAISGQTDKRLKRIKDMKKEKEELIKKRKEIESK